MREIFISPKRNRYGKRYGVVRFKGVQDAHHVEKKLDSMVFGGLKMYVNTPKFGRPSSKIAVRGRAEGKHTKKGATRSTQLLEIVYTDICGPFDVSSFGNE